MLPLIANLVLIALGIAAYVRIDGKLNRLIQASLVKTRILKQILDVLKEGN
jgi:hypothetical protein